VLRESRTPARQMPLAVDPAPAAPGEAFVIWYSGVGGWGPTDRAIAARLDARGLPDVGVDSTRYFANRRSPQTAAADLAALIGRYGEQWGRSKVVLVGYSFGGAALPLMVPQLPPPVRAQVRLVVLLAPSPRCELVMRPWTLFDIFQPSAEPLAEAAAGLDGTKVLCIADPRDKTADCADVTGAARMQASGGHGFRGAYDAAADAIAAAAGA
jgi:type IV secretory pathway VirJ component